MMRVHLRAVASIAMSAAVSIVSAGLAQAQSDSTGKNAAVALDRGWQFRQVKDGQAADAGWLAAKVPGDVHLDLLAAKQIPDPFYRDNESKLQWIQDASWEYRDAFDVSASQLKKSHVDLVFDGLDGPAKVYLNGDMVLTGTNSFRTWRVAAKSHLHAGKNELRVVFESPVKAAAAIAATDPWQPKTKTAPKTYLRKPAYEYGWDWGPTFVTSGIWRAVRLEAWDKARIADFAIRQRDVSREVAHLDAQVEVEAAKAGVARIVVDHWGHGAPIAGVKPFASVMANLHAGSNLIDLPIEIRQPRLWWPAGYGDQSLYDFTANVLVSGASIDQSTVTTGLRSIVLDRHPDQWGRSFQLVVNGVPIFAKGADVIPFDSFPNRVTTADYRRILQSARDANMNMIRHWGGGYYESDEFYQICDELGIMVWQDFMFGNDWQPGTYDFKLNIEAEAEDQVRRLRSHPSIVIWCGNNETEVALNWAPRTLLPAAVKFQMWQDYLTEFSGILNRVVERLDAEIPYWPSSPSSDYEQTTTNYMPGYQSGDAHIWDVWHGRVPFSTYETHHARFVSEYGFQSFPEMRTIESFTEPGDRANIFTPVMLAHQKNNEGNSIIHDYLLRDYPEPKDFPSFLYVSQVLQAEGIKIGAEHFRRSRPETMGSIFWQLNDCWPVASWSSIDYYGRWKALQYYARRFYAPILVSPHLENGSVKVYVVSDETKTRPALLRVRLMDFDGKVLLEDFHGIDVAPLASKIYLDWPLSKLSQAGGTDTSRIVVVAELMNQGGGEIAPRNLIYIAPTKEVHLKPAVLTSQITSAPDKVLVSGTKTYVVTIGSPVLARDVYLSFGGIDAKLSDNYFDILPGEKYEATVSTDATLDELRAEMKVISLTDAFAVPPQPASVTAAH